MAGETNAGMAVPSSISLSGEAGVTGLSLPHSPRWHNGRLRVLNSGAGEFGPLTWAAARSTPFVFCPGDMRGTAFIDNYAVVTLSKPRHDSFHDLIRDARLEKANVEPHADCKLLI